MKKLALQVCGMLLLVISCAPKETAALEFESKMYKANEGENAKISLQIMEAKGHSAAADTLNAAVMRAMKEIIFFGEKPFASTSYPQLAADFVQAYRELKKEFPRDNFGFEADVKSKIAFQDSQRINLLLEHYTFTGGAHGYGTTTSLHFDAQTGKPLSIRYFVNDWAGLVKLAEAKFRENNQIAPDAALNDGGFMFEENKFMLSENVIYDAKGMTFVYNPYDIAAYVEGVITLELTHAEIAPYLKK